MKNKIDDVRNHLVQVMESLNDDDADEAKMGRVIERAKAMSNLANSYVNAVKVELDAIRLADEVGMLPGSVTDPQKCGIGRGTLGHQPAR